MLHPSIRVEKYKSGPLRAWVPKFLFATQHDIEVDEAMGKIEKYIKDKNEIESLHGEKLNTKMANETKRQWTEPEPVPNTLPPPPLKASVTASLKRKRSDSIAILPPSGSVKGDKYQPWLQLNRWELAKLRRKMRKSASWQFSDAIIARELEELGRGIKAYQAAKAVAEAGGGMIDEPPQLRGQKVVVDGALSVEAVMGAVEKEVPLITNAGMKASETKRLKMNRNGNCGRPQQRAIHVSDQEMTGFNDSGYLSESEPSSPMSIARVPAACTLGLNGPSTHSGDLTKMVSAKLDVTPQYTAQRKPSNYIDLRSPTSAIFPSLFASEKRPATPEPNNQAQKSTSPELSPLTEIFTPSPLSSPAKTASPANPRPHEDSTEPYPTPGRQIKSGDLLSLQTQHSPKVTNPTDNPRITMKSLEPGESSPDRLCIDFNRTSKPGPAGEKSQALSTGSPKVIGLASSCIIKLAKGQMVRLVCPTCTRDCFSTLQGFMNHCRIAHRLEFVDYEEVVVVGGKPIEDISLIFGADFLNTVQTLPRSTAAVGPLVVKRIDGQIVKLACPTCKQETFFKMADLFDHCRDTHRLEFMTYQEAIVICGQPIEVNHACEIVDEGKTLSEPTTLDENSGVIEIHDSGKIVEEKKAFPDHVASDRSIEASETNIEGKNMTSPQQTPLDEDLQSPQKPEMHIPNSLLLIAVNSTALTTRKAISSFVTITDSHRGRLRTLESRDKFLHERVTKLEKSFKAGSGHDGDPIDSEGMVLRSRGHPHNDSHQGREKGSDITEVYTMLSSLKTQVGHQAKEMFAIKHQSREFEEEVEELKVSNKAYHKMINAQQRKIESLETELATKKKKEVEWRKGVEGRVENVEEKVVEGEKRTEKKIKKLEKADEKLADSAAWTKGRFELQIAALEADVGRKKGSIIRLEEGGDV